MANDNEIEKKDRILPMGNASEFDVKASHAFFVNSLNALDRRLHDLLDERNRRYEELLMQMDRRYQERYESSQLALNAAFIAQKEAVGTALIAAEKAVNAALAASEKAVIKAETASEKRFENVNEFRAALSDQQRLFMPRSEAEAISMAQAMKFQSDVKSLHDKIEGIEKRLNTSEGRGGGMQSLWGWMIGAAALLLTAIALAFKAMGK